MRGSTPQSVGSSGVGLFWQPFAVAAVSLGRQGPRWSSIWGDFAFGLGIVTCCDGSTGRACWLAGPWGGQGTLCCLAVGAIE